MAPRAHRHIDGACHASPLEGVQAGQEAVSLQLNLRLWKNAPWAGYVALEGMAAIKCNAKGLQGLLQQVFRPLWTPPPTLRQQL